MPALKRSSVKLPWPQMRCLTKEERSAARKKAESDCNDNYNEEAAKSIVFGINAVTRQLEKEDCCTVLLDSTVNPDLLIKHIVIMANNQKVSVFVIPFLKEVTLNTVNFACAAIGLKVINDGRYVITVI